MDELEKVERLRQRAEVTYEEAANYTKKTKNSLGDMLNRFFGWCGSMIQKGNETMFLVERNGKTIISVPVTVFVIILVVTFWCLLGVMLVGLFCGCHYSFEGIDKVEVDVNKAMDSASNVADQIKKEFTENGKDSDR